MCIIIIIIMNPGQITTTINQYKNTIFELQQSMIKYKKKMHDLIFQKDEEINTLNKICCNKDEEINHLKEEIANVISQKDEEINRFKQESCHKDEEINRLKQEIANFISGNDEQTIQNLKDNNIPFKKIGPFILL